MASVGDPAKRGTEPNTANLMAHYTFDTDYSDSGTLLREGTAVGSVAIASDSPDGSAGSLDLNGGYIDLPAYDGPGWLASGVTITAWVKKDDPASAGDIFSYDHFSKESGSIQMRTKASGVKKLEAVAAGQLSVLKLPDFSLNLPRPMDIALWRNDGILARRCSRC